MTPTLTLSVLPETFAICRLGPTASIPEWANQGAFVSITRTADELSIVCPKENVPAGIKSESNWRAFKVAGPLDFALTGVMNSLTGPLAHVGITIFAISTYDTDYLLVRAESLERANNILRNAGHTVHV